MSRELHPAMPKPASQQVRYRTLPPRLLSAILLGAGITILLTCLETLLIWLQETAQHTLPPTANSLPMLLVVLFHTPLFLLAMVAELVVFSLLLWLLIRPRVLTTYLRALQTAQESEAQRYVPLAIASPAQPDVADQSQPLSVPTGTEQQEQLPVLDLLQPDTHVLLLGNAGMGKTMALHTYTYMKARDERGKQHTGERIPLYVPLPRYAHYLKAHLPALPERDEAAPSMLLDFLRQSDLPGMHALHSSLNRLNQRGNLLLLCDDLDETELDYQRVIVAELVEMMQQNTHRIVLACRQAAYQGQPLLLQVVNDGLLSTAALHHLDAEQMRTFVEARVRTADTSRQYTAGQVMQAIERSRFRYLCGNTMLLSCLTEIIGRAGIERVRQIDTRGRLLRAFVAQEIERERDVPAWHSQAPQAEQVIDVLARFAYAARWTANPNALSLRGTGDDPIILAQAWLDEHPAPPPFVLPETDDADSASPLYEEEELSQLLQFARDTGLIDLSPDGLLSFRHELLAQYFTAEYLLATASTRKTSAPLREELLLELERWSGPIALWAGLLDNPFTLAELMLLSGRVRSGGKNARLVLLSSLTLSLLCCGVAEVLPPRGTGKLAPVSLPADLEKTLAQAFADQEMREELADLCSLCAQDVEQELYRAFLLLLPIKSAADFLLLFDGTPVPDLLFVYLADIIQRASYEEQTKRLIRILGRFGATVVSRAAMLSQPSPVDDTDRSAAAAHLRLRVAAIQILGRSGAQQAVEVLPPLMGADEEHIASAASAALFWLGPELVLPSLLSLLKQPSSELASMRRQVAVLSIVERFLRESPLSATQYQDILKALRLLLGTRFSSLPGIQQQASRMLIWQGLQVGSTDKAEKRGEQAIDLLTSALDAQDDLLVQHAMQALQSIGTTATPRLLLRLNQPVSQSLRIRLIEVLENIGDPEAVISLLPLLADPSLSVQQQAASALISSAPASIPGLIDVVNTSPDEAVAGRAAQVLISIGGAVVLPVTQQLFPIVPGRTRLLVEVLEQVPDPRSIPALISLLQAQQSEPLLTVAAMRALGQIPEQLVVPPLLGMLEHPQAHIYEAAVSALGQLGEVALPDVLTALETWEAPVILERLRRAILCMVLFPGEQLIEALAVGSDVLAGQLVLVLSEEGAEAAQVLVAHLLDRDDRLNGYIHETLASMPGAVVVPPLLEVLDRPQWNRIASGLLLNYPEAIPPLIHLLGDPERDTTAASLLPQFGPDILLPLLSGLSSEMQEQAKRVIVALVRQRPEVLAQVVDCFGVPLSPTAREVLLEALTGPLADVSLSDLLDGLEDAHLVDGVSEALVRLEHFDDGSTSVLDELLLALRDPARQWGAETTLVKIGAPAVQPVGSLITDDEPSVALVAQRVLAQIGAPAFPFIWAASSDMNDLARRDAALNVLHQMPATVIQNGLVRHLVSEEPQDVAMALALLLERIHDESQQDFTMQEMIPALLAYVGEQESERTLLRILALLLFIGDQNVIDHLVQALYEQPDYSELIVRSFLLLGSGAERTLEAMLEDETTPQELCVAVIGILSMLRPGQSIYEAVMNINTYGYGLTARPERLADPEMLAIALSALGGLLIGGHWDISTLLAMQTQSPEGHPDRDLASALLGWRYGAYIQKLVDDLHTERDLHEMEMQNLKIEMDMAQDRIFRLQDELDHMHHEHSLQVDELDRKHREMSERLDYREEQRETLERENDRMRYELERLRGEYELLRRENTLLQRENDQIRQNS